MKDAIKSGLIALVVSLSLLLVAAGRWQGTMETQNANIVASIDQLTATLKERERRDDVRYLESLDTHHALDTHINETAQKVEYLENVLVSIKNTSK